MRSDCAARLASFGRRSFTRNGWRYRIHRIEAEGAVTTIDAEFTDIATGRAVRDRVRLVNAPTRVPDGEELNPDHDPLDPRSALKRVRFRDDPSEAIKVHLERARLAMTGEG